MTKIQIAATEIQRTWKGSIDHPLTQRCNACALSVVYGGRSTRL